MKENLLSFWFNSPACNLIQNHHMTRTEKNIDSIIKKINKFKIEATFDKEFKERDNRKIIRLKNESELTT